MDFHEVELDGVTGFECDRSNGAASDIDVLSARHIGKIHVCEFFFALIKVGCIHATERFAELGHIFEASRRRRHCPSHQFERVPEGANEHDDTQRFAE